MTVEMDATFSVWLGVDTFVLGVPDGRRLSANKAVSFSSREGPCFFAADESFGGVYFTCRSTSQSI